MIELGKTLFYLTLSADRIFLVPAEYQIPAGDLVIASITGEQRRVDEAAVAPFEVSEEQAQAYLRAHVEQVVAGVTDTIGRALGSGGKRVDLRRMAQRLGVSQSELRRDPEAAKAAFQRFADDIQAVSAAVASGDTADLKVARERMAAWGIDVGDTLDDLPSYVKALRHLDQEGAARAAASGLRALADTMEGDHASLGRRIDELIARLERDLGPFIGEDPERERRRRQQEYERSAKSAIADALRAAGITPLASVDAEHRDPDRET